MNMGKSCGSPSKLESTELEFDTSDEPTFGECYTLTMRLVGPRKFFCGVFDNRVDAILCGMDLVKELRDVVPLVYITIIDQQGEMVFEFNQVL